MNRFNSLARGVEESLSYLVLSDADASSWETGFRLFAASSPHYRTRTAILGCNGCKAACKAACTCLLLSSLQACMIFVKNASQSSCLFLEVGWIPGVQSPALLQDSGWHMHMLCLCTGGSVTSHGHLLKLGHGVSGLQAVQKHRPDMLEGEGGSMAAPLQAPGRASSVCNERLIPSRCRTPASQDPPPLWK